MNSEDISRIPLLIGAAIILIPVYVILRALVIVLNLLAWSALFMTGFLLGCCQIALSLYQLTIGAALEGVSSAWANRDESKPYVYNVLSTIPHAIFSIFKNIFLSSTILPLWTSVVMLPVATLFFWCLDANEPYDPDQKFYTSRFRKCISSVFKFFSTQVQGHEDSLNSPRIYCENKLFSLFYKSEFDNLDPTARKQVIKFLYEYRKRNNTNLAAHKDFVDHIFKTLKELNLFSGSNFLQLTKILKKEKKLEMSHFNDFIKLKRRYALWQGDIFRMNEVHGNTTAIFKFFNDVRFDKNTLGIVWGFSDDGDKFVESARRLDETNIRRDHLVDLDIDESLRLRAGGR